MIVDILTKFNNKKKILMTSEHPISKKSRVYKVMYAALMISQAKLNKSDSPLNNFELQRLLKHGLNMTSEDVAMSLRNSNKQSIAIDYLLENISEEKESIFLMMDIVNVTMRKEPISRDENASVRMFAKMFGIQFEILDVIWHFIECAYKEEINESRRFADIILKNVSGIDLHELKYYIAGFGEKTECNQKILNEVKKFKIIDSCDIYEDIVLYPDMILIIDHATVNIYGNISLEGGKLYIKNSRIIRKTDSHRACINLKKDNSFIEVKESEVDCRNFGMFIRAEAGVISVSDSTIYNTTRGASIRFWGESLAIRSTRFSECYSPEDGGAVMAKGGRVRIVDCHFDDCEAKRGGAVYAVSGSRIRNCSFTNCNVAEFGAAVFYSGLAEDNVKGLKFSHCHPQGLELVQHISGRREFDIEGEYTINVSTIIDCPVYVDSKSKLTIKNAGIFLNYPIRCCGSLYMKNSKVICGHLEGCDMIYLESSKECHIESCEFDGMMRTGGLNIMGCKMVVTKSVFRNMNGGRAIYNAYFPEIRQCIFNFCQSGAVYSQGGNIEECVFVNCRAKSGAGVKMYGTKGIINRCSFKRCVSEYSGGAIDKGVGQRVERCLYEDCLPDNVV